MNRRPLIAALLLFTAFANAESAHATLDIKTIAESLFIAAKSAGQKIHPSLQRAANAPFLATLSKEGQEIVSKSLYVGKNSEDEILFVSAGERLQVTPVKAPAPVAPAQQSESAISKFLADNNAKPGPAIVNLDGPLIVVPGPAGVTSTVKGSREFTRDQMVVFNVGKEFSPAQLAGENINYVGFGATQDFIKMVRRELGEAGLDPNDAGLLDVIQLTLTKEEPTVLVVARYALNPDTVDAALLERVLANFLEKTSEVTKPGALQLKH